MLTRKITEARVKAMVYTLKYDLLSIHKDDPMWAAMMLKEALHELRCTESEWLKTAATTAGTLAKDCDEEDEG